MRAIPGRFTRALLTLDAARRLGAVPVGHWLTHRAMLVLGIAERRLPDGRAPAGRCFPTLTPAAPALPSAAKARIAKALGARSHGPQAVPVAATHGVRTDILAFGDIRAFWEPNRLSALPLLAQAARLGLSPLARAEALVAGWCAANPPFRGPNWACGQEAAFRALHFALALGLLDGWSTPPPAAREFLGIHARRIAATRSCARAQDNNHPVSEAVGLYVIGLVLGDSAMAADAARDLGRSVARLVAPDGEFAQPSPHYHRLLLDTLALAAVVQRRLPGPPVPGIVADRAAAATRWLLRLTDPTTGALPRIGHGDDSALGDLSLAGPFDARGSLERAARLFCGASAGFATDAGCTWLGLPCPDATLRHEAAWRTASWRGWSGAGARGVLRGGGPLRFRPTHCDLLHFDLWDGPLNLLRDGGTGGYRDGPSVLWSTAGHNTIAFDEDEQMPRIGRFLLARWPRCRALPNGAAIRDHAGRVHERRIRHDGRCWTIEDRIGGPFRSVALRWRLPRLPWRLMADGVDGAVAHIALAADAPLSIALRPGIESLAYGQVTDAPILEARAGHPVSRLVTTVLLP